MSLAADVKADGSGDDGVGTLLIGPGAFVWSYSSLSLRGADINIDTSASPGRVFRPNGGSVTIRSSLPTRPMSLGGADNAVQGINLTDTELALINTNSGQLIFGDSSQTGNITLTTVATPAYSTTVIQSTTGAGQIIFDNGGGTSAALNGNGGTVYLTPGTGGIHVLSGSSPTISNGNLIVNGQLKADGLSLDNTGTATFRIDGTTAGTQYDQLAATGTVNLAATGAGTALSLSNSGYTVQPGDVIALITSPNSVTGAFSQSNTTLHNGDIVTGDCARVQ